MQVVEARTHQKPPLPSTWLQRTVRVQYRDCYGTGRETTGALLDLCPAGPVLGIGGAKTVICWDSLRLLELVED
jgi:hypothetical protein